MFPLSPWPLAEIRSWWEVPCIAHFCYIFRKPFKLPEFEIEVCYSYIISAYLPPLGLSLCVCVYYSAYVVMLCVWGEGVVCVVLSSMAS